MRSRAESSLPSLLPSLEAPAVCGVCCVRAIADKGGIPLKQVQGWALSELERRDGSVPVPAAEERGIAPGIPTAPPGPGGQ